MTKQLAFNEKPFEEYTALDHQRLFNRVVNDLREDNFLPLEVAFSKVRQGAHARV